MSEQSLRIIVEGFAIDVLNAFKWNAVIPFQGFSVRLEFAHSGATCYICTLYTRYLFFVNVIVDVC